MKTGTAKESARVVYKRIDKREEKKRLREKKRMLLNRKKQEQLSLESGQENKIENTPIKTNKLPVQTKPNPKAKKTANKKGNLKNGTGMHNGWDHIPTLLQQKNIETTHDNEERTIIGNQKKTSKKRRLNEKEPLQNGVEIVKKTKVHTEMKEKSNKNGSPKMNTKKQRKSAVNKDFIIDNKLDKKKNSAGFDIKSTKKSKVQKNVIEDEVPVLDVRDFETDNDDTEDDVEAMSGDEIGAWCVTDSRQAGHDSFQWMIAPHTEKEFFRKYWEKGPLYIQRNDDANYYKGIFSTKDFDTILKTDRVFFTKNLDVTSYVDGKRETHNPVGQAHSTVVWDFYNNGCSVRMLNPQTFHSPVWKLLYNLQEYFNCFCGANVYLTPPDTQGFAPHWDDIEAFILQLEGKKHWRVYEPRNEDEVLPVNSSKNLSQEELGPPILEVTLQPGDLLYFPRGYIHQGNAVDGKHSLHITVSTYQRNTWGHYLEKLLPQALSTAMAEDVEFRKGLPKNYLDVMGIVNMDVESPAREEFIRKAGEMVMKLLNYAPLDATADQRGISFMHDSLPPILSIDEKKCSSRMGGERWSIKKQGVENRVEIAPDTFVRLIRGNCIRVVAEEESVNLYHCLENSREYHEEESNFLQVSLEHAPAVEALVQAYPRYIAVENLPLADEIEKLNLASGLWERGLLVTSTPLQGVDD